MNRLPKPGEVIQVPLEDAYCSRCRKNILFPAKVISIKERKGENGEDLVDARMHMDPSNIPEECTRCGQPKPFLYRHELPQLGGNFVWTTNSSTTTGTGSW